MFGYQLLTLLARGMRFVAAFTAAAMAALAWPGTTPVSAQVEQLTAGPYVDVADEIDGPHRINVRMSPERPIVGTISFAIDVMDAATGNSIPDATVSIFGTPSQDGDRQYTPALNSPADRQYYVGRLEAEHEGIWAIDIAVESRLGQSSIVLSAEVFQRARGGDNAPYGTALYVFVVLVFMGGVAWLWHSSRRRRNLGTGART